MLLPVHQFLFYFAISSCIMISGFAYIPNCGPSTISYRSKWSVKYLPKYSTILKSVDKPNNDQNDSECSFMSDVLMVECGFGNDSHGQNATKAAVRACRNAIEFNSVSIKRIIPGGYDAMKLNVILGVPEKYQHTLNLDEISKVFPFGQIRFEVTNGGLIAPSGRSIQTLGDGEKNDDMVIVCAAVQIGY